ncbi:Tep1, partial [Symbiodinium sp. KB8]
DVHLSGWSDSILRFVAARGQDQLTFVERIDTLRGIDLSKPRKDGSNANAKAQPSRKAAVKTRGEGAESKGSDPEYGEVNWEGQPIGEAYSDVFDAELERAVAAATTPMKTVSWLNRSAAAAADGGAETAKTAAQQRPWREVCSPMEEGSSSEAAGTNAVDPHTIRVFVSSTFNDMAHERAMMAQRILPAIRHRLKESGHHVEVVDIDLRWGVTAQQSQEGAPAVVRCLEEAMQCDVFVGFLGQRRGWVPAAAVMKAAAAASAAVYQHVDYLESAFTGTAPPPSLTQLEMELGVKRRSPPPQALFFIRAPLQGLPLPLQPVYMAPPPELQVLKAYYRELKDFASAHGMPWVPYSGVWSPQSPLAASTMSLAASSAAPKFGGIGDITAVSRAALSHLWQLIRENLAQKDRQVEEAVAGQDGAKETEKDGSTALQEALRRQQRHAAAQKALHGVQGREDVQEWLRRIMSGMSLGL